MAAYFQNISRSGPQLLPTCVVLFYSKCHIESNENYITPTLNKVFKLLKISRIGKFSVAEWAHCCFRQCYQVSVLY